MHETSKLSCTSWVLANFGDKGKTWLSTLPQIINNLSESWELSEIMPLNNSKYNFTAFCRQEKRQVFLKISINSADIAQEAAALSAFAPHSIQAISHQKEAAALLLPRLSPAQPLHSLKNDSKQNIIAAKIMNELSLCNYSHYEFPLLTSWFGIIDDFLTKYNAPIPSDYLQTASEVFLELENSCSQKKLLHGDLHHDNILSHEQKWLIIDPKGVIGNPIYETACFMYNPSPQFLQYDKIDSVILCRLRLFSEILGYEAEEIAAMAYCQSVLSACWCIMDRQNCWKNALTCADFFRKYF